MRNNYIETFLFLFIINSEILAQLPPVAQALYTQTYNQSTFRGNYAITNGAQFSATADGNSFYLKWFPVASTPSATPLLITLHGSNSNVFNEFYNWHLKAMANGVGIIAIQWYRGTGTVPPNDYFDDNTLYNYIDTVLKRITYPSNKAMLHGFSRGSARSYALQYKDVQPGGKNYFCTIFSNAGKPDSSYTLYSQINVGTNHSFCNGKRWAMFCGGMDTAIATTGCQGMNSAKSNWVIANGGNVGFFIQDPILPHNGFCTVPAYMDSVLKFYLPCFNGTAGFNELKKNNLFSIFPNPASNHFTISFSNKNAKETIVVMDVFGKIIYEKSFVGDLNVETKIWAKGVYFYSIKNEEGFAQSGKVIVD